MPVQSQPCPIDNSPARAIAWFWGDGLESIVPGIVFRFPLAAALLVAVLASVLPARRAARLDPIQAISYE